MKRNRSNSQSDSRSKSPKRINANPFLDTIDSGSSSHQEDQGDSNEILLNHTIAFLGIEKNKSLAIEKKTTKNSQPESKSLDCILEILESNASNDKNPKAPVVNAAALLLPWVTKELLDLGTSNLSNILLWRALAASLKSLTANTNQPDSKHSAIPKALSGKMLLKLIRRALQTGLLETSEVNYAATCYDILLRDGYYFHPPLDTACQSLLPVIVETISNPNHSTIHSCKIIITTLCFLQRSFEHANPKTSFQLLSTEESLLQWSRIYLYVQELPQSDEKQDCLVHLVKKILWDGLFHEDNHLEGFRSLAQIRQIPDLRKKKNDPESPPEEKESTADKFQCYQANLFRSLEHLMGGTSDPDAKLVAQLMPLLMQGLLEKVATLEAKNQQKAIHKKKSSKSDPSSIQLFFFGTSTSILWRRLSSQVFEEDDNPSAKVCIQSVDQCMKLFLKYDNFVPSDSKKQMTRFEFLESLTTAVLETSLSESAGMEHLASILESLVRLDHRLVHDRLGQVLDFIISIPTQESCVPQFFVVLFQTYQQLRQFQHVMDSILTLVTALQTEDTTEKLTRLSTLLSNHSAKRAFADAISDSPSLETKKMFEILDQWIIDSTKTELGEENLNLSLQIAMQHIGVGLFRNAKVDKSTALEVAQTCEFMMKSSVQALCVEPEGQDVFSTKIRYAAKLYAWIQHMQMKCVFWLGYPYIQTSEADTPIPRSVKRLLLSVGQSTSLGEVHESKNSETMLPLIDDVLLLASFRLRKLDYLIHEQCQGDSEELSSRQQYEEEATRLARLMIQCAHITDDRASTWKHIAHVITTWAPYADKNDLQSFLMWMFSALAASVAKQDESASLDNVDSAVAQSLINDASFFEIREIWDQTVACAMDTVVIQVEEAIGKLPDKSAQLSLINALNGIEVSSAPFSESFGVEDALLLRSDRPQPTARLLNGALFVARIVCGLEVHRAFSLSVKCAASAARIQSLCCRLRSEDPEVMMVILDLISTLRLVAAKCLASSGSDALTLLAAKPGAIKNLLGNMKDTSICVLNTAAGFKKQFATKLMFSTTELIKAICFCYCSGSNKELFLDSLLDYSKSEFRAQEQAEELDIIVLCLHCSACLSGLCSAKLIPSSLPLELLSVYFEWIASIARIRLATSSGQMFEQLQIFAGAAFRYTAKCCVEGIPPDLEETMAELANFLLPQKLPSVQMEMNMEAVVYMTMGYALTNPPVKQRLSLIDKLMAMDFESKGKNACVCRMLCGLEGQTLHDALSQVARKILGQGMAGMELFKLLIHEAKSKDGEQIEALSMFSDEIFRRSLDALGASHDGGDRENSIAVPSSMIFALIQGKRLITLKERHIAAIFSQTSKALQQSRKPCPNTYSTCFDLVAALLQRFPNHICTCVPSLIAVLHAFLVQLLHNEWDDVAIQARCQQFTRLCELLLPNKEVYKKHVICLLLEFVHCLEDGMTAFRKECLLPSIFYLLDMLTKYEMQQLNALMNTTAKALFRSVHQSYNRLHAYKGR